MRMIILVAAACMVVASAHVARAEGAWCARDADGCTNCGFHTRAQCQATVAGTGGSCERNAGSSPSADLRGRKQRSN